MSECWPERQVLRLYGALHNVVVGWHLQLHLSFLPHLTTFLPPTLNPSPLPTPRPPIIAQIGRPGHNLSEILRSSFAKMLEGLDSLHSVDAHLPCA